MLKVWFEYVYPYTPIVDRPKFYEDYMNGNSSHFVIYAMMANAIPYSPMDLITAAGYSDRNVAQGDFVFKARLLNDFGCERRQLSLLQGSVVLSSFQPTYAPVKDFRFWFHNAVRLSTQMGLHRHNLREDLDVATYKLCQRIFWTLYVSL